MTQDGFLLTDEGRTISVENDSGTTAIEAGDIVYSATNDDVLTGTAASARNAYDIGDIKVKSIVCSDTGYQTAIGIAQQDIPAGEKGSINLEGVFMHPTAENIEAGELVQGMEGDGTTTPIANKVQVADEFGHAIGRALSGGSADGKYIIWKMTR